MTLTIGGQIILLEQVIGLSLVLEGEYHFCVYSHDGNGVFCQVLEAPDGQETTARRLREELYRRCPAFWGPQTCCFLPGTWVRGPCGWGAEIAEDCGGRYVTLEDANGDKVVVSRRKLFLANPHLLEDMRKPGC